MKKRRGSALYFTLIVVSIISAIAFGISSILFSQLRLIRGMGHSVVAFYNADNGIEQLLYQTRSLMTIEAGEGEGEGYSYKYESEPEGVDWQTRITVVGSFQPTKRGIQVQY